MAEEAASYLIISNIPSNYHTSDLRKFFSDYVERERFTCFHFRHRPERRKNAASSTETLPKTSKTVFGDTSFLGRSLLGTETCSRIHGKGEPKKDRPSTCCIVKMSTSHCQFFIKTYHRKQWLDSDDLELGSICLVSKIKFGSETAPNTPKSDEPIASSSTLHCEDDEVSEFSDSEMLKLPELKPPNVMPRGNVGTSTAFFLAAIRNCRLPSKLIGKLKLEFPNNSHKKYGNVAMDYGKTPQNAGVFVARKPLEKVNAAGPTIDHPKDGSDPEDDDDTCEEWERHEALHNDVEARRNINNQVNSTSYNAGDGDLEQQPGTKERLFEEEVELVWEKGGSGLNFYTDAQYWKTLEGDFDEQTTDDWDVDMSVYYEEGGTGKHDKDALDALNMRRSEWRRKGQEHVSVFKKKTRPRGFKRKAEAESGGVGAWSSTGTGMGRRVMEAAGWRDGAGLGPDGGGLAEALDGEDDGQSSRDKGGLGFHGEKIAVFKPPSRPRCAGYSSELRAHPGVIPREKIPEKRPPPPGQRITSEFSEEGKRDPVEKVDRSNPPLYLKFRDHPVKFVRGEIIKKGL